MSGTIEKGFAQWPEIRTSSRHSGAAVRGPEAVNFFTGSSHADFSTKKSSPPGLVLDK